MPEMPETPLVPIPPDETIQPIEFVAVDARHFFAEYAVTGGGADIVVHFFPPAEPPSSTFWTTDFPRALEPAAMEVFAAGPPLLAAQHLVEPACDLDSWWLRASGFGRVPDPDALVHTLTARLDEALTRGA